MKAREAHAILNIVKGVETGQKCSTQVEIGNYVSCCCKKPELLLKGSKNVQHYGEIGSANDTENRAGRFWSMQSMKRQIAGESLARFLTISALCQNLMLKGSEARIESCQHFRPNSGSVVCACKEQM